MKITKELKQYLQRLEVKILGLVNDFRVLLYRTYNTDVGICSIHNSVKELMSDIDDREYLEVLTITFYNNETDKIYIYDKTNEKCFMNKRCDWVTQYELSIENQYMDFILSNEPEDFFQLELRTNSYK